MSIEFKAVRRPRPGVKNGKDYKYYPQIYNTKKVDFETLVRDITSRSSLNEVTVVHVVTALEYYIADCLTEGRSVELPGIGVIYPSIKGTSADTAKQVSKKNITNVHINFRPGKRLKKAIKQADLKKVNE